MLSLSAVARHCAGFGFLLGACLAAHAAPPATPVVTTSSGAIKRVDFDWDIVPRSNYYELWFQANQAAAAVKFAESVPWRPHASNNISAHLLDWQQARYHVKACNPSGCSQTAPIPVENLFYDSLGYFKATPSRGGARFGVATALSEDGKTLAVVADGEPSSSSDLGHVAVYVFAKSGSTWKQQARLRPTPTNDDNNEAPAVTISRDGNVVALGLLGAEPEGPAGTTETGAVYLFRRSGSTWTQQQKLSRPSTAAFFGFNLKLDESGHTLLVVDASRRGSGTVYKDVSGTWIVHHFVPGYGDHRFCETMTLSGDGATVVRICSPNTGNSVIEFSDAQNGGPPEDQVVLSRYQVGTRFGQLAVSYDANVLIASPQPTTGSTQLPDVTIIDRTSGFNDTLVPDWGCLDQWTSSYGSRIAISHDGKVIAVSDPADKCTETGSQQYPGTKGSTAQGAVYIYGKHSSGTWPRRRVLHRNGNAALAAASIFGGELALADNGRTLTISQVSDRSGASGVDGDRNSTSKGASGAVWMY
jgi:trimeric autotransporter adhesin